MDGLRPEEDELDRFNKRTSSKNKSNAGSGPPNKSSSSNGSSGSPSKPAGPSLAIFMLLVIGLSASFAWFSWQQQIEISVLSTRLSDASGFIDRSKLLIARLEGKLSETGLELAETGTAAEKKLAFLDSEMRKLWGVAYDKNRKIIEENQKQVDSLNAKLVKLEGSHVSALNRVDMSLSELSKLSRSLGSRLGAVANELSVLRLEQETVNAGFDERIVAQKNTLDKSAKASQAYLERAAKLDLSIESINASRRQINERIVELDKKLNALQLKITPSAI
tara:strand:+ start:5919 stop:6752 length:834 start_codon:yes stop_codon:yes gene_type:complete